MDGISMIAMSGGLFALATQDRVLDTVSPAAIQSLQVNPQTTAAAAALLTSQAVDTTSETTDPLFAEAALYEVVGTLPSAAIKVVQEDASALGRNLDLFA